ncbi:MAG: CHAT domain-containing protein [Symploca sp. SIO3E6]|nr:CHAT domain-containing protein [Caldora sp. SIO3E6]
MDEQRREAYLNLINTLLSCHGDEEINRVLNANQDLIDSGLLQVMVQVAEILAERGDESAANFLIHLTHQLSKALGLLSSTPTSTSLSNSDPQQSFLLEVLRAIYDSEGDPTVVYPLLQANLDKLDDNFIQVLQSWAIATKPKVEPEQVYEFAIILSTCCNLIAQFSLGNRAINLEIAIVGYEVVMTIFTRQIFPQEWAKTQNNLGLVYSDRILGERAENLEAAINYFLAASDVHSHQCYPEEWAMLQNNLGNAYCKRILGKRLENIEAAIQCYLEASKVLIRNTYPEQWAMTQNNLGNAYSDRICWNKTENIERAICCFSEALEVYTRQTYPKQWAMTQNNLGNAYYNRIQGSKAENLEEAIKYYLEVLEVYNREDYPEQWAMLQNNLGNAYYDRISGDKAKNIEIAIHYFLAALEVYTQEDFPQDWADSQNNLGNAYSERIFGQRSENVEAAIRCYSEALKIRSPHKFPQDWADTQTNIGIAYYYRIQGSRAENLEAAIKCYSDVLKLRTHQTYPEEWAKIQNNLGNAYGERIKGDKAENLDIAIGCFSKALKVYTYETFPQDWAMTQNNLGEVYRVHIEENTENIESAIKCYLAALEVYTSEAFPQDWGDIQNNLGIAYYYRIQGSRSENFKAAIDYFLASLKIRIPEAFPQKNAETQFNLGYTYQEYQQFNNAYTTLAAAIKMVESLRSESNIVSESNKEEVKQKLAEKYNQIYQCMVEVCLELKNCTQAIKYVERSKTRNLVELILTRDRHTIFPAEVVVQLDRLRDEIAGGQYELQNATAEDPTALAQHLQQLRQQRNELQDQYLPIGSGFQFEPFRSKVGDHRAIVEFYVTTDKLLVFIITKQSPQPIVLSPDLVDLKKLETWASSYLKAYSNKKDHWQRRLTTRLNLLAKILHFDEIIEQIPTECDQLTLIPHRFLHLLPLHALPLAGNSSLFERFPQGVSYAPSCQLLQLAQTRERPEFTHLFAVQNPSNSGQPLSYADVEVEAIQNYFDTSNVFKQKIATKEAIDETSLNTVHCAHFSCHGYFNTSQPRQSALILANAELNAAPTQPDTENYLSLENGGVLDLNKCLTLDKIFTLSLDKCRLVTLSACETGLIDFRNTSDEYIGLPSGFLYAGAAIVVSSLWTVNDLSTAFLMIRFYQNLKDGLAGALALNQAQLWLRDLTKGDLERWIEESSLPLKPAVRISLRRRLHKLEDGAKPFASPFYWAAFCGIGQ